LSGTGDFSATLGQWQSFEPSAWSLQNWWTEQQFFEVDLAFLRSRAAQLA
jgi:hypothetical protein